MRPFLLPALLTLLTAPLSAVAEEATNEAAPFALTYEAFETAVPHIDLPACPVELAAPDRFCRLTTHSDSLNVFVFTENGDQPLVALKSWPAELLAGLMD